MARSKSIRGYSGPRLYKSYVFRTKDPSIDQLRTVIMEARGSINNKVLREIDNEGGPSFSSMHSWFKGKVRRPQNAGLEAAGRAVGYERVWKKMNGRGK